MTKPSKKYKKKCKRKTIRKRTKKQRGGMESAHSPETVPSLLSRELIEGCGLKQKDTFLIDGENSSFEVLNIEQRGDMVGITAKRLTNPDANPEITTYGENFPYLRIHYNLRDDKCMYVGRQHQSSIDQGPFRQRSGGKRKRTKKKRGGDEQNEVILTFKQLLCDNYDGGLLDEHNCHYIGKYFRMIHPTNFEIPRTYKYIGPKIDAPENTLMFNVNIYQNQEFPETYYGKHLFKLIPEDRLVEYRVPRIVAGGPPYSEDDLNVISEFIRQVSIVKDMHKIEKMIKGHDKTIGLVKYVSNIGNTILHYMYRFAIHLDKKDLKIIKLLIDNGIDVNHQNNIGNTVLHMIADDADFIDLMCADSKKIDLMSKIIILLRQNGANVNIVNNAEQTPIVLAVIHNACADIHSAFTRHLESAINATPETLYEHRMTFPMRATSADINAEEND